MTEKTKTKDHDYSVWRASLEKQLEQGANLEKLARQTGLPFNIRTSQYGAGSLLWHITGDALQDFTARVKLISKKVGTAPYRLGTSGDGTDKRAPSMFAHWKANDIEYSMYSGESQCKIDPRSSYCPPASSYAPGKSSDIHPECKSVLDNLTDECEDMLDDDKRTDG